MIRYHEKKRSPERYEKERGEGKEEKEGRRKTGEMRGGER
jgi:hypothetical protein